MVDVLAALTLEEALARILGFVLSSDAPSTAWLAFWGATLFHAVVIFHVFAVLPLFFIWLERKVSARIQDRLGPTRVGGRFGWLQTLADGIKLIQKEDLVPSAADGWLFRIAPLLACGASFAAFVTLPWAAGWWPVGLDAGAFLVLALLSLEVFGVILGGYASGSKWSLFGGMREAAQMVSYEIPKALCVVVPILAVGTLDLRQITALQAGWFGNWLIFHDPFTLVAFFVYFTTATASVKRAPFDLAEAESELVGGFHTEYSGLRWSLFFLAEYASMFAVSAVGVVLFLGGWETGLGIESVLMSARAWGQDFVFEGFSLGNYLINLFAATVFLIKGCLLVFVQVWVRWTLPRLRIDQVMTTCLKYLVPISCALLVGATLWPLLLVMLLGRTSLLPTPPLGRAAAELVTCDAAAALQARSLSTPTVGATVGPTSAGATTVLAPPRFPRRLSDGGPS